MRRRIGGQNRHVSQMVEMRRAVAKTMEITMPAVDMVDVLEEMGFDEEED